MNILITGGAGYIGSHVLKALLERGGHEIIVIDNLSTGSLEALNSLKKLGKFEFERVSLEDLSQIKQIIKSKKIDTIIHFAAFIEVFESVKNPLKYYLNNTANSLNLMNSALELGVEKFVFSSTAATYGEPKTAVVQENDQQNPINPYGKSKLMVEWALKDAASAHEGFKFAILRYFNVAGASSDGLIGQNYPNATHLIKVAVQAALGKREKMSIFGTDYATKDGTCVRDYIHVEDLASAHLSALDYIDRTNSSQIFNVGYGRGFSVKEVVDAAKKVSGAEFKVEFAPRRAGDPAELIADATKLRTIAGWKPAHEDLEFIIKTALEWEKRGSK